MDEKKYADILDNRLFSLEERANELAEGANEIKIAVGYFYVSGFDLLRENVQSADNIKLIIGRETDFETKEELIKGFEKSLGEIEDTDENREGLKRLYELIREDKVDVHVYTEKRFHPKLYLFNYEETAFPGSAIIGSSNMSPSGLLGNVELNVEKKDSSSLSYLNRWFEEIWQESEEFKSELIKVIERSKFRKHIPTETKSIPKNLISPYTATKLFIAEQFPKEVQEGELLKDIRGDFRDQLAEFQDDAVRGAKYSLNKYDGVILADSVGLGKSYIGARLVQEYSNPQSKVLIIGPKRLLEKEEGREQGMWKRLLSDEFPVRAKKRFLSYAKLSRLGPNEINRLRDYDVVLIDEAHRLRNQNTKRYNNLQAIGRQDKKHILLTATPIQNSVMDLNNVMKIFADDSDFTLDLPDSPSELFRKYDKLASVENSDHKKRRKLRNLRENIEKVMQEVLISRTRDYILDKYEKVTIEGREIKSPERIPNLVSSGNGETKQLYHKLIELIAGIDEYPESGLNLPYVSVDRYGVGDDEELLIEYKNASMLLVIHLFKRLESSLKAFYESVDRLIRREEIMRDIAEGNIDSPRDREEIIKFFERLDDEGILEGVDIDQVIEAVENLEMDERRDIVDDVSEDLIALRDMRRRVSEVLEKEDKDPKVEKLRTLLKDDLKDEKAIVFTQFVPTAEYVFEKLTGTQADRRQVAEMEGADKNIAFIHGDRYNSTIIEQFAPEAQEVEVGLDEKEIDVLIATDVLSVGQNLQDSRVVVNYDLRWNPMRMEQRIGRIDRITTPYEELLIYNFIPTKDLQESLGILETIRGKITSIAETIGKASPILEDTEKIVDKNIMIYDKLGSEDMEFKDRGFIGVTHKYDQIRNSVKEFSETENISIEDLQQVRAFGKKDCIAFQKDSMEESREDYLVLANLEYTSGRTETQSLIVGGAGGFGGVDMGDQTMLFDIPIVEDDKAEIFDMMKSSDNRKYQGDINRIEEVLEIFGQEGNWNDKILDIEVSLSDRISEITNFCEKASNSDDFEEETVSKAEKIKKDLEKYDLTDYFENELDKVFRKRNRPNWGWKRTINELYRKLERFELAEPEKVKRVDVRLTEKLENT